MKTENAVGDKLDAAFLSGGFIEEEERETREALAVVDDWRGLPLLVDLAASATYFYIQFISIFAISL